VRSSDLLGCGKEWLGDESDIRFLRGVQEHNVYVLVGTECSSKRNGELLNQGVRFVEAWANTKHYVGLLIGARGGTRQERSRYARSLAEDADP
jgi:hypothetical protein